MNVHDLLLLVLRATDAGLQFLNQRRSSASLSGGRPFFCSKASRAMFFIARLSPAAYSGPRWLLLLIALIIQWRPREVFNRADRIDVSVNGHSKCVDLVAHDDGLPSFRVI